MNRLGRFGVGGSLLLVLALGLSSCAILGKGSTSTEQEIDYSPRLAYIPQVGANRADVESVLGEPTFVSRTKEGQLSVMYQVATTNQFRTVVYDDHARVVSIYPEGSMVRTTVAVSREGGATE